MMVLGKDSSVKVTLDDVDDPKTRKRAKIKRPDGAPAKSSGSAAAITTQIDKDAIYKELDEIGPFNKTMTGALEPESFVKLRSVIGKHAYLTFVPRKDQMMKERLEHLKAERMKEYQTMIQKAA